MTTRRTLLTAIGLSPLAALPFVAAASPDERIEAACEEIKRALSEKYGWRVTVKNQPVPVTQYAPGGPDRIIGYHRHVILIDASSERYADTEARWYTHIEAPRRAADVVEVGVTWK